MRNFTIVIPTHGRPRVGPSFPAAQFTFLNLPPELQRRVVLVTCCKDDLPEWHAKSAEVIRCPRVKNVAEKRDWIMRNIPGDFIFMLDDDMRFFARTPLENRRIVGGRWVPKKGALIPKARWPQIVEAFNILQAMADDVPALGLSSRQGNLNMTNTIDRYGGEWRINGRMMHAFGLRKDVYKKLGVRFADIPVREDFNMTLHLLRRGHQNAVLYSHCCSPGRYDAPGGASTQRTVKEGDRCALLLAKTHPGLVKVVDRAYTDSTPRKEVIVYWQKAFKMQMGGGK